jgi:hypothetical protein
MNDRLDKYETSRRACVAFAGQKCICRGGLTEVALAVKKHLEEDERATVIILDAETAENVEVDLRGTPSDVAARLRPDPRAAGTGLPLAPGRPKLGVVAREVTLLPRHWEWLNEQPGGASVTLRKLVEEARRSTAGEARVRRAREACYRFMSVLAGNEPGYEEALRALFGGGKERFESLTEAWPPDVRDHARRLAADGFAT